MYLTFLHRNIQLHTNTVDKNFNTNNQNTLREKLKIIIHMKIKVRVYGVIKWTTQFFQVIGSNEASYNNLNILLTECYFFREF